MSNSIFENPAAQPTPMRVEPRAPSTSDPGADAKAWHSAFQHALGDGFQRWFQPPGAQGPSSNATHGPIVATWAAASAPGHAGGATAPARHATPAHGEATAARHAAQPDAAAAPAPGADGTASNAVAPLAAPAAGFMGAFEAPESREQALASTLAALTGVQVELVSGVEADVDASAPAAVRVAGAAPQFADASKADEPAPSAPAGPPSRPAAASDEREPLRVHAQWSDDGVHLWLGADVGGLAAVSAVTSQLQQALAAQGTRLLRVICNGRDISPPPGRGLADAMRFDAQADPASAVAAADRISPFTF